MKKICLAFCILFSVAFAGDFMWQFRVAYFYPQEKVLRDIYQNGGVQPEFEFSYLLNRDFRVWGNFNAFGNNGRSLGSSDPTDMELYSLSAGIKFDFFCYEGVMGYVGVGPSVTWAVVQDTSLFVNQSYTGIGPGVVGKAGILVDLPRNFLLDFFADYSYEYIASFNFPGVINHSLNVGGLRAGVGVGGEF